MVGRGLVALLLLACGGGQHPKDGHEDGHEVVDAVAGEALVVQRCTSCHSESPIYGSMGNEADWHAVVHRMVYHHKAKLISHISDDEAMAIARYLAEVCKPDAGGVHVGAVPTGRRL